MKKDSKINFDNLEVSATSRNGVIYYKPKGNNIRFQLRGQPRPDSPFGVVRCEYANKKWDIDSAYHGSIINCTDDFDLMTEGCDDGFLWLNSISKGWIMVEIASGHFIKNEYVGMLNDGRRYKFTDETVLRPPQDIIGVYFEKVAAIESKNKKLSTDKL